MQPAFIYRLITVVLLLALGSCSKDTQIPEDAMIQIELRSNPPEGGTVAGEGSFLPGTMITVIATPSDDYTFHRWTENGNEVSAGATYTFEGQTDRTLTAEFHDYQDPLIGTYHGTRHHYSWMMGSPPTTYDTIYPYSFTVSKHPTSLDSIIVNGGTFPIDTSLSFFSMPYPGNITSLDFRNDSCLIYFRSGGLGGYFVTDIKGLRQ